MANDINIKVGAELDEKDFLKQVDNLERALNSRSKNLNKNQRGSLAYESFNNILGYYPQSDKLNSVRNKLNRVNASNNVDDLLNYIRKSYSQNKLFQESPFKKTSPKTIYSPQDYMKEILSSYSYGNKTPFETSNNTYSFAKSSAFDKISSGDIISASRHSTNTYVNVGTQQLEQKLDKENIKNKTKENKLDKKEIENQEEQTENSEEVNKKIKETSGGLQNFGNFLKRIWGYGSSAYGLVKRIIEPSTNQALSELQARSNLDEKTPVERQKWQRRFMYYAGIDPNETNAMFDRVSQFYTSANFAKMGQQIEEWNSLDLGGKLHGNAVEDFNTIMKAITTRFHDKASQSAVARKIFGNQSFLMGYREWQQEGDKPLKDLFESSIDEKTFKKMKESGRALRELTMSFSDLLNVISADEEIKSVLDKLTSLVQSFSKYRRGKAEEKEAKVAEATKEAEEKSDKKLWKEAGRLAKLSGKYSQQQFYDYAKYDIDPREPVFTIQQNNNIVVNGNVDDKSKKDIIDGIKDKTDNVKKETYRAASSMKK